MKNNLFLGLSVGALVLLGSCQNAKPGDETSGFGTCAAGSKAVRTVTNATGTVSFDSASQQYRISVPQPGTIDVVEVGVVCGSLPSALRKDGTKVSFSGTYKEYASPPSAPAGTTFYYLELSKAVAQ